MKIILFKTTLTGRMDLLQLLRQVTFKNTNHSASKFFDIK